MADREDHQLQRINLAVTNAELSVLAEIAVEDSKRANRTKFKPMSHVWLEEQKVKCVGCLAGVILFTSLGLKKITTGDEDRPLVHMQNALDSLRMGSLKDAYEDLGDKGARQYFPYNEYYVASPYFRTWDDFDDHIHFIGTLIPKMKAYEKTRGSI